MLTGVDDRTIRYVAELAKLEILSEEQERVREDLSGMLMYANKLQELKIDGVEEMVYLSPLTNVFREDEMVDGFHPAFLNGAPDARDHYFVVPRTIDGASEG